MEPVGIKHPRIYLLGDAPDEVDDVEETHFSVGPVRDHLPKNLDVRWNYCVRTHPPDGRAPNDIEMECCRPSVEDDIAKSKPFAIFGFGNVPLRWLLGTSKVTNRVDVWAGRCVPVEVKGHKCWYFPMLSPAYVEGSRRFHARGPYGSEIEFGFAQDMRRALGKLETLEEPKVHSIEYIKRDIELVDDLDRIIELLDEASQEPTAGFDYETNALRPYGTDARVLTIAVSTRNGTFAFGYRHSQSTWTEPQLVKIDKAWRRFLKSPCRKISHNLPFELEWTAVNWGCDLLWQKWEDTLGQAYILDERQGAMSLEFLCLQYFGFNIKKISNVDALNLDNTPLNDVLTYNAIDAKYHRRLYMVQKTLLEVEGLTDVYRHQAERISAIVHGQIEGVPVDQSVSRALEKRYTKELKRVEKEINETPEGKKFISVNGFAYRPASQHDVRKMFKIMGKAIESTDEKGLAKIKHPIAKNTIAWRKNNKLLGTYIKPCLEGSELLFPDGKLHPIISTVKTRTWRTSSEYPNIQNFPKRAGKGIEARSQIRVDDNHWIVAFDYAGIQARNVAMESKDKALVKAFWKRYDIHTDWMERMIKICPTWYNKAKGDAKEHRSIMKNSFVFPSLFGARPASMARSLNVDEKIAQQLQEEFWVMFPDIHKWHSECHKFYREHGYISGLSGFRRRAPIDPNQLINAPIQADESRIVLDAMIRLSKRGIPVNMEIHDDLTFIWHKKDVEKNVEIVVSEMTKVAFDWINVPIAVEAGIGREWSLIKPVGEFASDTWKGNDPNIGSWADGTGWVAVAKETK